MNAPSESSQGPRGPRNVLEKAWADIKALDVRNIADRARAEYADEDSLVVSFFSTKYIVDRTKGAVSKQDGGEPAHRFVAALILHYLIGAKDVEPTGRLLTFRELEGGDVYYDAFYRRAIAPLAQELGSIPRLLLDRAKRIGGEPANIGDASVRVLVFPKIPVVAVVWMGDDEVPSSANILFDTTAGMHLHTEDLAAVGDLVADALVLSDDEWRGW